TNEANTVTARSLDVLPIRKISDPSSAPTILRIILAKFARPAISRSRESHAQAPETHISRRFCHTRGATIAQPVAEKGPAARRCNEADGPFSATDRRG